MGLKPMVNKTPGAVCLLDKSPPLLCRMFLSQSAFLFLMPWQCWSSATGQQTCLVLFAQVTCPGSSVIRVCLPIRIPGYMVLNTLLGRSFTWMLLCPLITMFIHSTNIYWVPGTVLRPGNIIVNKVENKTKQQTLSSWSILIDIKACSTGFLPHLPQLNTFPIPEHPFPAPSSLQSAVPLQWTLLL